MTEIEERGKEFCKHIHTYLSKLVDDEKLIDIICETSKLSYNLGATDQQKIDEAKYNKLLELAYNMYTAITGASGIKKAVDEFYHYINFEENKED